MRKKLKWIAIGLGIAIFLFALFVRPYPFQGYYEGFLRHRVITSEIKEAAQITAIEHSDWHDQIEGPEPYHEKYSGRSSYQGKRSRSS